MWASMEGNEDPGFMRRTAAGPLVRPTWCEIDLGAVTHNLVQLRAVVGPGVSIFVCLKSDAHGCGATAVALHCQTAGADGLAFGSIGSAIACRDAGAGLPLLLYPTCLPDQAELLEYYDLMPTVSTIEDVAAWSEAAKAGLKVFLKIDGGAYRAGAFPNSAPMVANAIARSGKLKLAGVYGHPMANYGHDSPGYVSAQIASFAAAVKAIEEAGIQIPIRMVSSSTILLDYPDADLDGIDPGRLVVGVSFPSTRDRHKSWRRAVHAIKSRLVMVKTLDHDGCVPEAPFLLRRPGMRLGLIPMGWSDGYPARTPSMAEVLIRGRRVPIIPPVHSEIMRIDLTGVPDATVGDEVVILGRSGSQCICLEELCNKWGMADSEIYVSLVKSLTKVYLNN